MSDFNPCSGGLDAYRVNFMLRVVSVDQVLFLRTYFVLTVRYLHLIAFWILKVWQIDQRRFCDGGVMAEAVHKFLCSDIERDLREYLKAK